MHACMHACTSALTCTWGCFSKPSSFRVHRQPKQIGRFLLCRRSAALFNLFTSNGAPPLLPSSLYHFLHQVKASAPEENAAAAAFYIHTNTRYFYHSIVYIYIYLNEYTYHAHIFIHAYIYVYMYIYIYIYTCICMHVCMHHTYM